MLDGLKEFRCTTNGTIVVYVDIDFDIEID